MSYWWHNGPTEWPATNDFGCYFPANTLYGYFFSSLFTKHALNPSASSVHETLLNRSTRIADDVVNGMVLYSTLRTFDLTRRTLFDKRGDSFAHSLQTNAFAMQYFHCIYSTVSDELWTREIVSYASSDKQRSSKTLSVLLPPPLPLQNARTLASGTLLLLRVLRKSRRQHSFFSAIYKTSKSYSWIASSSRSTLPDGRALR